MHPKVLTSSAVFLYSCSASKSKLLVASNIFRPGGVRCICVLQQRHHFGHLPTVQLPLPGLLHQNFLHKSFHVLNFGCCRPDCEQNHLNQRLQVHCLRQGQFIWKLLSATGQSKPCACSFLAVTHFQNL